MSVFLLLSCVTMAVQPSHNTLVMVLFSAITLHQWGDCCDGYPSTC